MACWRALSGMTTDKPRLQPIERMQHVLEDVCLDTQLPVEHRARRVWAFVERCDLTPLEKNIKARGSVAGAPSIPPRLLLALWLVAQLDGVGSARELDRLCGEHIAYRWLCGRIGVNHHTLSDFRARSGEFFDALLSDMIASLVKAGVVDGSTIHQDGTKIKASAGRGSFRRESTLERLRVEAAAHVAALKAQAVDPKENARVRSARERAAREGEKGVEAALLAMESIKVVKAREIKKKGAGKVHEGRASTTDADARLMTGAQNQKIAGYNVQFGTDARSRAIVGVQVVQAGCDNGLSESMRGEVERRTRVRVKTHVTDAGYLRKETVEREESAGVERVMPLPKNRRGEPVTEHQDADGPGVRAWRERMQTPAAAELIKQRGGVAETPNGELKSQRAMDRMLVRGLNKVTSVVLLSVIGYNLMHFAVQLTGRPMPAL